jgi:hypothetical protein
MDFNMVDQRIINLYSKDAVVLYNTTYLSNVLFDFKNVITEHDDVQYITCGVLNAQIPVSFYTINDSNNKLNFSYAGGAMETITITNGNYNSNSLISEFISKFATLGYTYTIVVNRVSGKITFASNISFVFYGSSSCFPVLGFKKNADYASTGNAVTGVYPLNLLGVKKIKVISSYLVVKSYDSLNSSTVNCLASIPVDVASYGLITYSNDAHLYPVLNVKTVNAIDIQLLDEDNQLIDFNGIHWCITLQFNIYKKGIKTNNNIMHIDHPYYDEEPSDNPDVVEDKIPEEKKDEELELLES